MIFLKRFLRDIVFSNPEKLKILEALIHPFLERKMRKIIRKNSNTGLVFVDIALLFEMKWDKFFDFIMLADVDEEIQKLRVMKRDNITAEDFYKINILQMPRSEKIKKVDFVVDTDVSLNKLQAELLEVVEILHGYE